MSKNSFLSVLYIMMLSAQIFLGVNYEKFSVGLFADTGGEPFSCRELLSSGSDDDLVFAFSIILIVSIVYRVLRFPFRASRIELAVLIGSQMLLGLAISVGTECGQILYTAFLVGDRFLIGLLLLVIGSIVTLIFSHRTNGR